MKIFSVPECKECKYSDLSIDDFPCCDCVRINELTDYYEKEEGD